MCDQDTCSYHKEEVYFNPTVYRTSQTTKNYESYKVNNVDFEKNYGLRERGLSNNSKTTFTWPPSFERESHASRAGLEFTMIWKTSDPPPPPPKC